MKISFYADNFIEPWDYRNVLDVGIGGSETSQVEMALRLAARGHEVTSYGPLPDECQDKEYGGVDWRHFKEADLSERGLWIIYRNPSMGPKLFQGYINYASELQEVREQMNCGQRAPLEQHRGNRAEHKYWHVCQDVFYPNWRSEDAATFDRIIGLCPRHCEEIRRLDKANAGNVCMSSNGVNVERIEKAEREAVVRNPKRLIWASSPDRGLKECLDIFERAREQVPDLELHCFYGMDNIDKICSGDRKKMPWRLSWDQYDRACAMPGVIWRGRVGQKQLTREWLAAGIWLYPTWFPETSCISCMEAQCCGCIPLTNPIWATGHNVKHGIFIEGDQADALVKARYVDALVRVASDPEQQERMRTSSSTHIGMMEEARRRLSWERFVDQWEEWIGVDFLVSKPKREDVYEPVQ